MKENNKTSSQPQRGLKNFFKVPHELEEGNLRDELSPRERQFMVVLFKLENRFGDKKGWFWHLDREFSTKSGSKLGFESFGFSKSSCTRIRKKLKDMELIETKPMWSKHHQKLGTRYRIKYANISKSYPEN